MRIPILSVVFALLLIPQAMAQADKPLDCGTGPITKVFGGTSWLVRSCDGIALHVLSDSGNPAFPFYFLIYPSETEKGRFVIEGEGTGDKQASAAALADIRRLSAIDIASLIAETKQQKKK
ncbi:hypothetical protein RSO01_41030 [Reyranella soli]|uniref:Uncharacterized protein n=2 Tax=Reyranella soli TaxID=1230389 RepID=A0A512NDB4_9HYPH|nr:hypothetical protein RSO01_41030 [Reyranella soli]